MNTPVSHDNLPELPILDRAAVLERLGGDEDMLQTFLDLLLQQADTDLPKLTEAVQQGDAGRVEHLAHSLKGAAASLSAERVRQAAYQLESIGRSGDLTSAEDALAQLRIEVDQLRPFLKG